MDDKEKSLDGALIVADDDELDGESTTGEPGDGKAEDAADVLSDLVEHMNLDVDVEIREDEERIVLDVTGEDVGRAIGKKGQTLDALQFLVNKIVNRFPDARRHVVVDAGDYRERHDKGLITMAHREAKRAVQQGKVITLEPMSARDRRVIHLSLAKFSDVTTRSDGQGLGRRIQIIPAGSRGRGGGGGGGNGGGNGGGEPTRYKRRRR